MSELRQIEARIYNEDRIEELLEHLDCWNIMTEQHGILYVAGLPEGDNPRSVQIKNIESLSVNIRSKGITGSIFDLVSYIIFGSETEQERKETLSKSKFWICNKLNYPEFIDEFYKVTSDIQTPVKGYNDWLKKASKKDREDNGSNVLLSNEYINDYQTVPYYGWYKEGLSISTQKCFQIGIDVNTERITFPVHNKHGEMIGIKGRYCGKNKEIEDKYKYLYLIPCNKSIELFNLHRALPHILRLKEVIIVEGGKTTMFLTQWNYPNVVSIEGDSLSPMQIKLLKDLGLDIKYIFAYDKDKNAEYVKKEASKLTGRMKYGIIDLENNLEHKDSPTDKGKEVWDNLYKNNKYKI
ncbi:DNA primase [Lysinibacillus sp. 1 U-2021]|uniref:DNA primase n=1 Tax=Lysinibacillus sp. 1 U-2021 TaxID=3039426 RepID=UPI00248096C1|nr:DNA primase [Lysinibacillus sp. 1 U-2021]WGT37766.1 DNA primase [Lysinibacillus sp. 1 U-2021]